MWDSPEWIVLMIQATASYSGLRTVANTSWAFFLAAAAALASSVFFALARLNSGSHSESTERSFSGMIALSVMWMSSGQTSVQHLVMLHMPRPPSSLAARAPSLRASGCMSSSAYLRKNRGPANDFLFSSWSRMTWQTFWHMKHSMHLRYSCSRLMSSWNIRRVPSAPAGSRSTSGMRLATS